MNVELVFAKIRGVYGGAAILAGVSPDLLSARERYYLARYRDSIGRKHSVKVKGGTMSLAAVFTMANAHSVRFASRLDLDLTARTRPFAPLLGHLTLSS
jgi:hypothetical protein